MVTIIPLGYQNLFSTEIPKDYLGLISAYPKNQLLNRLAFLSSKTEQYLHSILERNDSDAHLAYLDMFVLSPELTGRLLLALRSTRGEVILAYTRDSILYAMEEILCSNLQDGELNEQVSAQFTNDVFNYLLCINGIYFKADQLTSDFTMEELNAALLPANNIPEYNAFTCCIKGVGLIKFLMQDPHYHKLLVDYIASQYGCSIEQYMGFFLRWGLSEHYNVNINPEELEYPIFKKLSSGPQSNGKDVQKLNCLRISPVYQTGGQTFVVLDKPLFVGKIYYQFIYEFWFSCVKVRSDISAKVYFSRIGHFFEQYCSDLLKKLFSFLKHPPALSLDELKYGSGKGAKEVIDFYARDKRKIVIGEFKLGNLNDQDRYSGNTEGLYSRGEDTFFKNLDQLDSVISQLEIVQQNFDPRLEHTKRLTIYPVCIMNDIIYEFPTMKIAFSRKWEQIRKKYTDVDVKSLVLFQVEELEDLVYKLSPNNNKMVWDILHNYCKVRGEYRAFSLAGLKKYPLDYHTGLDDELQGYMNSCLK